MSARDSAGEPIFGTLIDLLSSGLLSTVARPLVRCGAVGCLLLMTFSCTLRHVDFRPRESLDGESPSGQAAAGYQLVSDEQGGPSELHVWSDGATLGDAGTTLHIGFEIENRFRDVCTLDLEATRIVELEYADAGDRGLTRELANADLVSSGGGDGSASIAAGETLALDLAFALPSGIEPRDVRSFAVKWAVSEPEVFEQRTPFRRAPRTQRTRPFAGTFYGGGILPFGFYRAHSLGFRRGFGGRYCPPVFGRRR